MTKQKLTSKKIGLTLQKEGFKRADFPRNGKREKGYNLEKIPDLQPFAATDSKPIESSYSKKFEPEKPMDPENRYWDGESEVPF
jgi:hypothetical protein